MKEKILMQNLLIKKLSGGFFIKYIFKPIFPIKILILKRKNAYFKEGKKNA